MRQKGLVFGSGRAWKGVNLLSFVLIIARVVAVGVPGRAAQATRTGWQRFRLAMFVAVNSGSGKERRIEAREGGRPRTVAAIRSACHWLPAMNSANLE